MGESVVTAALLDVFDEAIFHDDTTLNDLLDRAGKLETTVKLQVSHTAWCVKKYFLIISLL